MPENILTGIQAQFRLKLSPAKSCHCVNITFSREVILNSTEFLCGKGFTHHPVLCSVEDKSITLLTQIYSMSASAFLSCSESITTTGDDDAALAYEGGIMSCDTLCSPFRPISINPV